MRWPSVPRGRNMNKLSRLLAIALALMLVVAACSSSDDDTTTSDDTEEESDTTESEEADEAEETDDADDADEMEDDEAEDEGEEATGDLEFTPNYEPPTEIGPNVPLDSVPEVKTVAWLECSLPSCQAITPGFEDATAALGWNLEVISWSTDAAAAFQQALDQDVDYVALTGTAEALIQDQLDQAAEQGVAFFSCYDTSEALGEENNIWLQCGGDAYPAGYNMAVTIAEDSGGSANVLMVNIPDFAALVREREGMEAGLADACVDCTFSELPLTLDQLLAGEVPGALVSALQADPDVDYVHIAFDGLAGGVTPTLIEADLLEGRKITGVDFSGVILEEIVAGTMFSWNSNPKEYASWLMVDGMARHSIGQENTQAAEVSTVPSFVVTTPEAAEPWIATDGWPGPDGMDEQFKALWGI